MIDRIWKWYVLVNYCGQRATGSFFTERSIINTIMFEISFVTSGVPFGLMKVIGVRTPWVGALLAFGYVMLLWKVFESKIKKNIDFKACEQYYMSLGKGSRILSFITTLLLLSLAFLFMFFSIKLIF